MGSDALPINDNWYCDAIASKWDDPAVKHAILALIRESSSELVEGLDPIEDAVFGARVACPHDCGSLNLPGAPICWGCEEKI